AAAKRRGLRAGADGNAATEAGSEAGALRFPGITGPSIRLIDPEPRSDRGPGLNREDRVRLPAGEKPTNKGVARLDRRSSVCQIADKPVAHIQSGKPMVGIAPAIRRSHFGGEVGSGGVLQRSVIRGARKGIRNLE